MNWRTHIHSDPGVLGGKPVFVGTRYTVERVLKLVGAGWSYESIAGEYPGVLPDHLTAAASFAADLMRDDIYIAINLARAA